MDTSAPDVAPIALPPETSNSPPDASIRLTLHDGVRGWLEAKTNGKPLYGSGSVHIGPEVVVLHGWQRNWLGVPVRSELRLDSSTLDHAAAEGPIVLLQYRRKRRAPRLLEFRTETAEQAAAIVTQIRAIRPEYADSAWVELRDFNAHLAQATPRVFMTYALMAASLVAYIGVLIASRNALLPDLPALTQWGSNDGVLTLHGACPARSCVRTSSARASLRSITSA